MIDLLIEHWQIVLGLLMATPMLYITGKVVAVYIMSYFMKPEIVVTVKYIDGCTKEFIINLDDNVDTKLLGELYLNPNVKQVKLGVTK